MVMTIWPCRHSGQWQARSLQRDRGGSPADLQFEKFTFLNKFKFETSLSWKWPFLRIGIPSLEPRDGRTGSSLGMSASGSNLDKKDQDQAQDQQLNKTSTLCSRSSSLTNPSSSSLAGVRRQTQCLVSGFATLPLSFPSINFSSFTFLNFLGQNWIS